MSGLAIPMAALQVQGPAWGPVQRTVGEAPRPGAPPSSRGGMSVLVRSGGTVPALTRRPWLDAALWHASSLARTAPDRRQTEAHSRQRHVAVSSAFWASVHLIQHVCA